MSQTLQQGYTMKDSGIDWIGEIPEHWKVVKIKNGYRLRPSNVDKKFYDHEVAVQLCNYVDVYYNDKITEDIAFMNASASEHEINKFKLEFEDVIITKDSEDPMDIGVPALVKYTAKNLVCGYHLTMLKPNKPFSGAYLFWCLNAPCIQSQLYREACGVTRWAISNKHIKNVNIPLPSPSEQLAIATYLDKATQQIDNSLQIKRDQLKILNDYRKSLIYEKVTRGLNPNCPRKPSGIDWIGDIPEHWSKTKLRYCISIKSGEFASDKIIEGAEIPVYGGNGVMGYSNQANDLPPTIAIGRVGAYCGNAHVIKTKSWISDNALIIKTYQCYDYLAQLIRVLDFNSQAMNTAQPVITSTKIKNTYVYLPPKTEQEAIANYLDKATAKIDKAKQNLIDQISTLTDYRKSLIHECVTGQKRVYFEE